MNHYNSRLYDYHPGRLWKNVYMDRYVRDLIETLEAGHQDEYTEDFRSQLELCAPFVHYLHIKQLQPWSPKVTDDPKDIPVAFPIFHINLNVVLSLLPNIKFLEIQFGLREVGINYDKRFFQIDPDDLANIALGVNNLRHCYHLKIHNSNIYCEHIHLFAKHLNSDSLTELDLSFNKIGDEGARHVAKILMTSFQLKILILKGNLIKEKGAGG